jgi:hypothetical protein
VRLRVVLPVVAAITAACSSSGGHTGSSSFEVRPLIMPGLHTTHPRPNPFGSMHVPATEEAYAGLSHRQQAALKRALRAVDCAHPPTLSGTAAEVRCDKQSDAFLLGAAIVTGQDVEKASPIPPNDRIAQWSVQLTLTPTGTEKLKQWTTRHHSVAQSGEFSDVQRSAKPPCGPSLRTACSDFLAYLSDDTVVTVPVTFAPTISVVTVLGAFNQVSATRLADSVTG